MGRSRPDPAGAHTTAWSRQPCSPPCRSPCSTCHCTSSATSPSARSPARWSRLLIVCAIVRLMLGVFLRGTGGSILAVAVLHTIFNRSNNDEGMVAGARRRRRPQARRPDRRPDPDRRGRDRRAPSQQPGQPLTSSADRQPSAAHRHPRQGPGMNTDANTTSPPSGCTVEPRPGPPRSWKPSPRPRKIPGMSVAVASPDRLLYAGAVGYADLAEPSGLDRRGPVPVVLHDQDRHRHHRHAAARRRTPRPRRTHRHLPARLPATPHARSPHDARSCSPTPPDSATRCRSDGSAPRTSRADPALLAQIIAKHGTPKQAVGARASYSNIGYLLAGEVIAAATGRTVEDCVRDRVLDPLGMDSDRLRLPPGRPSSRRATCAPHASASRCCAACSPAGSSAPASRDTPP